ncbi:MAG TPA: ABC transporter substrate-binding protein [Azospirillaceae bacterium]|nr:ABC transporter substrate-binding protein [Azospirillaceae bacterium]
MKTRSQPGARRRLSGPAALLTIFAALAGPLTAQAGEGADGALRLAIRALPATSDPHVSAGLVSYQLMDHLHAPLVAEDAALQAVPALAESWEAVDSATWHFTLRPGVTFQNGAPLTGRDVVYSFCRVLAVAGGPDSLSGAIGGLLAVETPKPGVVRLRFRKPMPNLPDAATSVAIVAAPPGAEPVFAGGGCHTGGLYESADFDRGDLAVGAGPYRLVSFDGGRAELVRHEGYWGAAPAWERVEMRELPPQEQMRALLDGSADLVDAVMPNAVDYLRQRGMKIVSSPSNTLVFLQFNQQRARGGGVNPLADRRVREALAGTVDRRLIVERALGGFATPTALSMDPRHPGPDTPPPLPLERARVLLAEAGWAQGFTLRLVVPHSLTRAAEMLAYGFDRIGVKAEIQAAESPEAVARMESGDFDVLVRGWMMSAREQPQTLLRLVGAGGGEGEPANPAGVDLPELDRLLRRAAEMPEGPDRRDALREAERIVAEEIALVPLYFSHGRWALRPDLRLSPRLDRVLHAMNVHRHPSGPAAGSGEDGGPMNGVVGVSLGSRGR